MLMTMKQIPLLPYKQGKYALIDDEDYEQLKDFKWYLLNTGYAARRIYNGYTGKKQNMTMVLMHRQVMNTPDGKHTDHINHDTLDNRKKNLRVCTHQVNMINRRIQKNNTSGVVGVRFRPDKGKWKAEICIDKRNIHLGYFSTKEDAIEARVKAEKDRGF